MGWAENERPSRSILWLNSTEGIDPSRVPRGGQHAMDFVPSILGHPKRVRRLFVVLTSTRFNVDVMSVAEMGGSCPSAP